jgi:hypothetical protein
MNKAIKNAFTTTVAAATIAWSIGLAAMPLAAKAADYNGQLVKASLPAVYYVGMDGKRYVFPNEKTYKTWYADFSGVMTITDAELASMAIGGNVTYKPGVRMVKITTDPKVYAVGADGTLHWVSTEAAATALYGASWNQMIDDVPDAFFTNYKIGMDITTAADFDPAAAAAAASSISVDKGLSGHAGDGSLSVMLSSPAAMGGTLPGGATGVEMLKFEVKNMGSSAMTLDSATIKRSGPGVAGDWAWVYMYEGNHRLTTGRTINATTHEVVFGGLNLILNAGESKHLMVIGDVAAAPGAGNVHNITLESVTASGVSASGVPVMGPNFTMAGATVGNVNVEVSSTPSNPKAGEMGVKVASFKLSETGAPGEDVHVHKVALYYTGTLSSDKLSNLVLKQSGNTLATASGVSDKDILTFILPTPFALDKGASRTFDVYGDISGEARSTDNIKFYLDQPSDILAIGQSYGWGASVNVGVGALTVYNATNAPTLTIQSGQLTLSFNGPSSTEVARDAEDVEIFNVTMAAQSNLEVRNTDFACTRGAGLLVADIADVKLIDTATGAIVAGPMTYADAMTFTESFYLSAGQARTLKLTVDVENTAPDGGTLVCNLGTYASGADVRNLDNSQYLVTADFVPSAAIGGNPMTVRVASLALSGSSTPVSQNYIIGAQGVGLLGFNLKANDASDLKVTQIVLDGYYDANQDGVFTAAAEGGTNVSDVVLSAKLMNGATQVGDIESPNVASGQITFDNLNLMVPKSSTLTLQLVANLNSSLATVPDALSFDIALVGNVSAEDKDGNPLTAGQKTGAAFNADPLGATNPPVTMTVLAAGTLNVERAPDDTESEAGLVVGGASNVVLGKFKFTAIDEELKLTKSRVSVAGASVNGVASLSLYDGSTLVGGPVNIDGTGNAYFTGMNFVIPKDGSKVLTVKGNLNSVGASGATTGIDIAVTLQDGYQGAAIDNNFEARGTSAGSSTVIQEFGAPLADNDIAGRTKVLRKTKPTVSLVTLPSSVLSTGSQTIMRFTIAADAAGDVAVKHLRLDISKTANPTLAISADSNLRRVGDSSNLAGSAAITGALSAAGAATGTLDILLTNEEVISAGTARTYDVRLTVGGAPVSGDSVSASLAGETVGAATESGVITTPGAGLVSLAGAARNFVWSDISAVPHSDTLGGPSSADWANGWYVKVLPTDSQTMSK